MTQKDRKLLLKDLSSRVPYGVKYMKYSWGYELNQEIPEVEVLECVDKNGYISHTKVYKIDDIKPYLFPLSSMTEEQMEELEELCSMYTPDDDYHPYAHMGIKVLYKHVLDDDYKISSDFNTDVIDWLNKNHFDYRGLIEKGLAIDATNKNIY